MWWIISIILFVVALAVATSFCMAGKEGSITQSELFKKDRRERERDNRSREETHGRS